MKRFAFVFAVLATFTVFAQERRVPPNQRIVSFLSKPGVAESIGVPQEKIDSLKKQLAPIQAEQTRLMEEFRGKIRENYQSASEILTKHDADPAKLIAKTEETGRLQTQIAVLDIKKLVVIRDNLTPEQTKALLAKLKEALPPGKTGKKDSKRQQGRDEQRLNGSQRNGQQPNDPR